MGGFFILQLLYYFIVQDESSSDMELAINPFRESILKLLDDVQDCNHILLICELIYSIIRNENISNVTLMECCMLPQYRDKRFYLKNENLIAINEF